MLNRLGVTVEMRPISGRSRGVRFSRKLPVHSASGDVHDGWEADWLVLDNEAL
jgi:hypothetical protein